MNRKNIVFALLATGVLGAAGVTALRAVGIF